MSKKVSVTLGEDPNENCNSGSMEITKIKKQIIEYIKRINIKEFGGGGGGGGGGGVQRARN